MHTIARGMTSKAEAEALAEAVREFLNRNGVSEREVVVGPKPYNVSCGHSFHAYDDYIGDTIMGIVRGFRAGWAARKRFGARERKKRDLREGREA